MNRVLLGVALGFGSPLVSQAGQFAYGLGYSATSSDNITRAPANERSDVIHSLLSGIAYQERTVDLAATILAQAEYTTYRNDTFPDETVYYVDSFAVWTISPQRFYWTVQDVARQAVVDTTIADIPTNRVGINVFTTGPDFSFRFSPVQSLAVSARARHVYTGSADVDSKNFSASVGWLYNASSVTTYSLNYQAADVQFDNSTLNNDYLRQDLFLRADYHPARSQYVLDLGSSNISRDRGEDLNGTLARLSWIRQLTTESTFGLSVNREFSDTGTDLLALSRIFTTPGSTVSTLSTLARPSTSLSTVLTSDVYTAKGVDIYYTRRGSQLGVDVRSDYRKYDFETLALDREETSGNLAIDLFYSAATTARIYTDYTKTEYTSFMRKDTERQTGIRIGYRLTRTIGMGLEALRKDVNSTGPALNYVDNRAILSIVYSNAPLFTPVHGK